MAHIVIDARGILSTTGRYTRKLLEYLALIDHPHRYTVIISESDAGRWTPPSDRFSVVTSDAAYFSLAEQTKLARQIRSLSPDLVHFTMQQQPLALFRRRLTTFHDLTLLKIRNRKKSAINSAIKRALGAGVFYFAARRAKTNIVPSDYSGNDLRKFARLGPERVARTYEAADLITESAEPLAVPFDRFILFVGNQVPYKNLSRLVEATRALRLEDPGLGLVVAGKIDGDGQMLIGDDPHLTNDAHFTGFVSEGELRWLYENAEAFVFPSLFEGFGLPGLEAMVHGCPVISSDATCLPEVYGTAAQYFDPRDTADMTRAIGEVIVDRELRSQLIQRGHQRAATYSWARMAAQTLDVYNAALPASSETASKQR